MKTNTSKRSIETFLKTISDVHILMLGNSASLTNEAGFRRVVQYKRGIGHFKATVETIRQENIYRHGGKMDNETGARAAGGGKDQRVYRNAKERAEETE